MALAGLRGLLSLFISATACPFFYFLAPMEYYYYAARPAFRKRHVNNDYARRRQEGEKERAFGR